MCCWWCMRTCMYVCMPTTRCVVVDNNIVIMQLVQCAHVLVHAYMHMHICVYIRIPIALYCWRYIHTQLCMLQ